jgi:hypothetical protein
VKVQGGHTGFTTRLGKNTVVLSVGWPGALLHQGGCLVYKHYPVLHVVGGVVVQTLWHTPSLAWGYTCGQSAAATSAGEGALQGCGEGGVCVTGSGALRGAGGCGLIDGFVCIGREGAIREATATAQQLIC